MSPIHDPEPAVRPSRPGGDLHPKGSSPPEGYGSEFASRLQIFDPDGDLVEAARALRNTVAGHEREIIDALWHHYLRTAPAMAAKYLHLGKVVARHALTGDVDAQASLQETTQAAGTMW